MMNCTVVGQEVFSLKKNLRVRGINTILVYIVFLNALHNICVCIPSHNVHVEDCAGIKN